jgi:hypothetical protein
LKNSKETTNLLRDHCIVIANLRSSLHCVRKGSKRSRMEKGMMEAFSGDLFLFKTGCG